MILFIVNLKIEIKKGVSNTKNRNARKQVFRSRGKGSFQSNEKAIFDPMNSDCLSIQ